MTLSRALQEAYASGDTDGIEITTLEIDHPSLDVAIRLAANVDSALGEPGDTVGLPIVAGGEKIPHLLCAFTLVRPGADQDGPTDGKIQIDNVSDLLHDLLQGVIGYDAAITVGFRQYRVLPGGLDAVTGPDEEVPGLQMTTIEVDANRSEGTIMWPDGRTQNVPTGPNAFFSRSDYPGLFS